jgi:heterodisulfide reductase subunit C
MQGRIAWYYNMFSMYEYAERVLVNLPPPRTSAYYETNYDAIQQRGTEFASAVAFRCVRCAHCAAHCPPLSFFFAYANIVNFALLRQTRRAASD